MPTRTTRGSSRGTGRTGRRAKAVTRPQPSQSQKRRTESGSPAAGPDISLELILFFGTGSYIRTRLNERDPGLDSVLRLPICLESVWSCSEDIWALGMALWRPMKLGSLSSEVAKLGHRLRVLNLGMPLEKFSESAMNLILRYEEPAVGVKLKRWGLLHEQATPWNTSPNSEELWCSVAEQDFMERSLQMLGFSREPLGSLWEAEKGLAPGWTYQEQPGRAVYSSPGVGVPLQAVIPPDVVIAPRPGSCDRTAGFDWPTCRISPEELAMPRVWTDSGDL